MNLARIKALIIAFFIVLGVAIVSVANTLYLYNAPIDGKELTILITHGCSKNDGLKWIRRSYIDSKKFTYQCNDSALFRHNYVELKK